MIKYDGLMFCGKMLVLSSSEKSVELWLPLSRINQVWRSSKVSAIEAIMSIGDDEDCVLVFSTVVIMQNFRDELGSRIRDL